MRRIGVFMPGVADDPEFQAFNAAFLQRLAELGWIVGRNVRIDYRWGAGDAERYRAIAASSVELAATWIGLIICGTKRPSIGSDTSKITTKPLGISVFHRDDLRPCR